jgi:KUP system potassium uptake protein
MVLWFVPRRLRPGFDRRVPSVSGAQPLHAVRFLAESGLAGFFILSEVILCATGGEALYADMGHLKREHIIHSWYFVFVALVINYFGQGSYVIRHPNTTNVLFQMVYDQSRVLYIPFLLLSVAATVIASWP